MSKDKPKVRAINGDAPSMRMKRWRLPDGLDCKTIVMRCLNGNDELEVAVWAGARATSAHRDDIMAMVEIRKHEAARRAIVAYDGIVVGQDGLPFSGMDNWSQATMACVMSYYMDLNAVEPEELKKSLEESEEITDLTQITEEEPETSTASQNAG